MILLIDYQKGDSAFLYVFEDPKKEKLTVTSTDLIRKYIKKGKEDKASHNTFIQLLMEKT